MTEQSLKLKLKSTLALFFTLSGITGLIYQVVWFKYLSLFLGNTTYAQMIVLATFLGGLALGNFYFGNLAKKLKNPPRLYGILELIIGIYCIAYPTLSYFFGEMFYSVVSSSVYNHTAILYYFLKFILSALLLLVPTIAMGGTLPILSRFFVDDISSSRQEVAKLYFLNSFGAVIGVFFAGFVLIKAFGIAVSIYLAGFINIVIGLAAIYVSNDIAIESKETPNLNPNTNNIYKRSLVNVAILVGGISGFSALLYELAWTRLLVNFLGSSTYAFSIMLMAFISGITIGGLLISTNYFNKYDRIKLLILCQLVIGISTMIVLFFYSHLPYWILKLASLFVKNDTTFTIFLGIEFLICFLLMFIPTIFMGMTLPLIVEIVERSQSEIGKSVGKVFSVNTIGTVCGTIITALIFIPFFGIRLTFEIGIALNLLGVLMLIFFSRKLFKVNYNLVSIIVVIIFVLYHFINPRWDKEIMLSGVFRSLSDIPPKSFSEFRTRMSNKDILFYKEGLNATVAVIKERVEPFQKILLINGKGDASSVTDMPTQVLLGQIPMLLHPNPKQVFVVGLGSGVTIGSVLSHPVDNVDCVEISKEVVESVAHFSNENSNCMNDKRLNVIVEDAHTYLKLTDSKYDVIISEPSNPWIAGIGNLFSKEYFEKCRLKLNEDGIMVQWFHIYEMNDEIMKMVMSTFNSVFDFVQVWNGSPGDIILVGSNKEIKLNLRQLQERLTNPTVKADLNKIQITNPITFLSCQVMSPEKFYSLCDSWNLNSEIHPRLEFLAPKSFYLGTTSEIVAQNDERFDWKSDELLIKQALNKVNPSKDDLLNLFNYQFHIVKNYRFCYAISKFMLESALKNDEINLLYLISAEKVSFLKARTFLFEKFSDKLSDSSRLKKEYANDLLNEKLNSSSLFKIFSAEEIERIFNKISKQDSLTKARLAFQFIYIYLQNSELNKADSLIKLLDSYIKDNPNIRTSISMEDYNYLKSLTYFYKQDYNKSIKSFLELSNSANNFERKLLIKKLLDWRLKNRASISN